MRFVLLLCALALVAVVSALPAKHNPERSLEVEDSRSDDREETRVWEDDEDDEDDDADDDDDEEGAVASFRRGAVKPKKFADDFDDEDDTEDDDDDVINDEDEFEDEEEDDFEDEFHKHNSGAERQFSERQFFGRFLTL